MIRTGEAAKLQRRASLSSPHGKRNRRVRHREEAGSNRGTLATAVRRIVAVVIAVLLTPASTFAATGLRMENALPLASLREGGPLSITGELQWDRTDLLEGRLRFVVRNGPEVVSAVETDTMIVVSGITRFRQLLPVPEGSLGHGISGVDVSFLAEDVHFPLGEIPVPFARQADWHSVVLCLEPTSGAGLGEAEQFRDAIAFERAMATADATEDDRGRTDFAARTSRVLLPASDFPEQPLAYCICDAVLLPGEGFTRLSGRQLDGIAAWVRAGGAACIAIDRPLEEKQAEFLAQLFRDSDAGPFVRDDAGLLLEPEGTAQGVFVHRAGLGIAVVVFGPLDKFDFETPAWREAHARFWRLRQNFVALRRGGEAITAATTEPYWSQQAGQMGQPVQGDQTVLLNQPGAPPQFARQYQQQMYQPHPRTWTFPTMPFGTSIAQMLRPESIRLLPGWTVLLILFGYVALVGPLDYLLLGWLRSRKWTWVTFPTTTLAVTWGVVATADAFMSGNDRVRFIEIVDLDANGVPVRRSRFDLHFRGSSEPVLHEVEQAFFSRLDSTHFTQWSQPQWIVNAQGVRNYQYVDESISMTNDAPTGPYVGTLPSRYVVPQQIAKWTPQVNRTFEIAPKIEPPNIDWAALERRQNERPQFVALPDGMTGNVIRFGADAPHGAQENVFPFHGDDSLFGRAATALPAVERGLLQFQRSPLGLGRLDDLPFVDPTAGLGAIGIWKKDAQGNFTIYRKRLAND